ncbi:MAG: TIGR03667 family PPOX class F420-dependent oxidoreductase [Thermomicrobiales bacterium]
MAVIDTSTEFGSRVAQRLADEIVIWLTTTGAGDTPQPSPVWFYWDGESALIYSQPNKPKLRNIERNPRVSLNFNSSFEGGDVVVFTGNAVVEPDVTPADQHAAFVEKYTAGIASIGMTPASFAAAYSVGIRVTPDKLRGF